jgi:anaerobic C4-dicarboxylate transporter
VGRRDRRSRKQTTARATPKKTHGATTIRSMPVICAVLAASAVIISAPGGFDLMVKLSW